MEGRKIPHAWTNYSMLTAPEQAGTLHPSCPFAHPLLPGLLAKEFPSIITLP